ncbi:MAG: sugar kinase [Hyphomicrobiaceae bacterium]
MTERQVVAIGECMIELARGADGRFCQSFGGDTFNTSVYLARCGVATAYATALGVDAYSTGIVELAEREGVATHLTFRRPGRMPGLYLIETTPGGERSFFYWRDRAPARELLDGDDAGVIADAVAGARLVYFSGITLSLYSPLGLDRLAGALERARSAGAHVAMDSNYRPRGWGDDQSRARQVMERFWRLATIGLPTHDDEAALWGDTDAHATIARLGHLGVEEVAVKLGAEGVLVAGRGDAAPVHVPASHVARVVDTTAAGDSFNAAYLAARLDGRPRPEAARAGHRLAGVVVAHRGAIVPLQATNAVIGR